MSFHLQGFGREACPEVGPWSAVAGADRGLLLVAIMAVETGWAGLDDPSADSPPSRSRPQAGSVALAGRAIG